MKTRDVPPPTKWIEKLDRLAASEDYDDAAIVFDYCNMIIFSWQTHKLANLEWAISNGKVPVGFVAFKWCGVRLNLQVWYAEWASKGELFAAETALSNVYRQDRRTDHIVNEDWSK